MHDVSHTDGLTYLIARLHRFAHNRLESRLQERGFTVENWRILEALAGRSGYSMGELASLVLMNHPALTKMIDRMVAGGLVHRSLDPADQRRVLVFATDRGKAICAQLRTVVAQHEQEFYQAIGNATARRIEGVLTAVDQSLAETA